MLQRGHSGDECDLASTLCKYALRKINLFVLSWARVRRVMRGSISSKLLVCGGGVHSILLLPLVARCLETRFMYMAHAYFYVFCSDCGGVCGNVCCVAAVVENSVVLPWSVVVFSICIVRRGSVGMGNVSDSSCRCCMVVSCVHPVAVLNAAFCITCSLLMLIEDARGDHMPIP